MPQQITTTDIWEDSSDDLPFMMMGIPASNGTNTIQTVSWSSEGTIKLRMQWIGVGPGPSRVLVKITSNSQYSWWIDGEGSASNGIGSPLEVIVEPPTTGYSSGSVERFASVIGGVAEVELDVSANASDTGLNAGAIAIARGASIQVAERAVEITSSVDMTAHKGPTGLVEPNLVTDITSVYGDTAVTPYESYLGEVWGEAAVNYSRALWGSWTDPFNQWWWTDTNSIGQPINEYAEDGLLSEIEWVSQSLAFTPSTMSSMVQGTPQTFVTRVKVTNDGGSGLSREATFTMRFHSPIENPVIDNTVLTYGDTKKVCNVYVLTPGQQPIQVTITDEVSESVTQSLSVGSSLELKLFKFALNYEWGETANIRKGVSTTYTFTAQPVGGSTLYYTVKRKAYWHHLFVSYDVYDIHGFNGVQHVEGTKWVSLNKIDAERYDCLEGQFSALSLAALEEMDF